MRSDNARDYFNQFLTPYLQKEGIIHESSCVTTPQQNGVAERKNRHLLETTRALLFQNNVPKTYWGEAVLTSTYVINRLPSKVLGSKSPLNLLAQFHHDIRHTFTLHPRVFGCTSFVHIHDHQRGKLDPRAVKCVFIGYLSTQKGYKCFHPPTRKYYTSSLVTFVQEESYFTYPETQNETSESLPFELSFEPQIPNSKSIDSDSKSTDSIPLTTPSQEDERLEKFFDKFRFDQVYARRTPDKAPQQDQSGRFWK